MSRSTKMFSISKLTKSPAKNLEITINNNVLKASFIVVHFEMVRLEKEHKKGKVKDETYWEFCDMYKELKRSLPDNIYKEIFGV